MTGYERDLTGVKGTLHRRKGLEEGEQGSVDLWTQLKEELKRFKICRDNLLEEKEN